MSTVDVEELNKRITIVSLGERIDSTSAYEFVKEQYQATQYRDAFHLVLTLPSQLIAEAWLFDYGILVTWDISEADRLILCESLAAHVINPYDRPLIDRYRYNVQSGDAFKVYNDCLTLPNDEALTRLALSHAFAQSAKLDEFEFKAQTVINENAYISKELASTGRVPLGRKALAKLRGVLFDTSSDIALHFNLLDTPEFFWDYPRLEDLYLSMARYLDINARLSVLNKKLETIQNLLDMLASEQNHKHSAFLEWVIIILIAIDIVIYFF